MTAADNEDRSDDLDLIVAVGAWRWFRSAFVVVIAGIVAVVFVAGLVLGELRLG